MKQIFSILTMLSVVILLSGQGAQAQDDWTLKSPATKPVGRYEHAMASLGGDQVLLFGGVDASGLNDETWVYDLSDSTWTLKSPATKPSVRYAHAMASLGGDQVLLFGGFDGAEGSGGAYDDETWVYDLSDNTWTLKSPDMKPSARFFHAMASLGGDQVLLFGGSDGANDDETWVYDLSDNTWTLKSPDMKPSARYLHAMASLGGDQVLLFGGVDGAEDDETWVYDLSDDTWTLKGPAIKPSARHGVMASLGGDQVLLFGGYDGAEDDETWVYDLSDSTWTLKSPAAKPSARHVHAMVSLGGDQVLLFSGINKDDETWVYTATPASPATIEGVVSANANGLANVTVKLLDAGGLPVEGIDPVLTGAQGHYSFANIASADYQIMIVEPLGYAVDANPRAVSLAAGETETVDFFLTASVLSNASRGKGYWKHQFDVYITGKGSAQETEAQLNSYIASVHTFYDPHSPVFAGTLTFANWQAMLSSSKNAPMLEKAKEHLAALVLNFASLKIGQYTFVTADNRTAGEVLTYVSTLLSDANASNDELAKDLAEKVNSQLAIAGGVVPAGTILYKNPVEITDGAGDLAHEYSLSQNYPNPFNPTTTIKFGVPSAGPVVLRVYDMLGREITTLVNDERSQGTYEVVFDATGLSSGAYVYRLQAGMSVEIKRLILLR